MELVAHPGQLKTKAVAEMMQTQMKGRLHKWWKPVMKTNRISTLMGRPTDWMISEARKILRRGRCRTTDNIALIDDEPQRITAVWSSTKQNQVVIQERKQV